MADNKKTSKSLGCGTSIIEILISIFFIVFLVFMIALPYNMIKSNQKRQAEYQKKGITEIHTTITDKEMYEDTDSDGMSRTDYYIFFPEGMIASSSWFDKVNVGDEVTVYTIDGKLFAFTKEELFYSTSDINFAFIISNTIVAVIMGCLLSIFYKKIYSKQLKRHYNANKFAGIKPSEHQNSAIETDYDAVNNFFLLNIYIKQKMSLTTGDFILCSLIVIHLIALVITKNSILIFIVLVLGIWLVFHFKKKTKNNKLYKSYMDKVAEGNYYTITQRVSSKNENVVSSGGDDYTEYNVEFENGMKINNINIYLASQENSLVHFFVVSDNLLSYQVIEKKPGSSEEYQFTEALVQHNF